MKVNCLSCGHNVELDEAYGDGYEGEIKCFGCGARLEIRTEQNALRSVRLLNQTPAAEAYTRVVPNHEGAGAGAEPHPAARRVAPPEPSAEGRLPRSASSGGRGA